MILNTINILTVIFGITSTVFAVKIYLLTRSNAMLWLVAATAYITLARATISISQANLPNPIGISGWFDGNSSFLIFLYWPIKAIAVIMLYLALKSICGKSSKTTAHNRRKDD